MDSDRVNRWLTLGANLGVIAGIVFLAFELRQNNQLLVEEARFSMLENQKEWAYFVSSADTVSDSVISPDNSSELSRTDRIRRVELISTLLFVWQWEFEQSRSDLFGQTELSVGAYEYGWRTFGIEEIWPEIRGWYSDDFIQFIEEEVVVP